MSTEGPNQADSQVKAAIAVAPSPPASIAFEEDLDDYPADNPAPGLFELAPLIWLVVVGLCTMGALYVVGYLSEDESARELTMMESALPLFESPPAKPRSGSSIDSQTPASDVAGASAPTARQATSSSAPAVVASGVSASRKASAPAGALDIAARRSAMAYSGVTLGITLALSAACVTWAWYSSVKKANKHRLPILGGVCAVLVVMGIVIWMMREHSFPSFTSDVGKLLLDPGRSGFPDSIASAVPWAMLALSCLVPCTLAAGACFLLQPMKDPQGRDHAKKQLRLLELRLVELDQLLYVGGLTLVFGTLQLSAALSIPLTSMPKLADLKNTVEFCKTLAPTPVSSPYLIAGKAPALIKDDYFEGFDHESCVKLPRQFALNQIADSLRQFSHGLTVAFGLALSALLSAIYVPALTTLRLMSDKAKKVLADNPAPPRADGTTEPEPTGSDVDPLRRIAAVAATLSPLLAGLIANTFAAN